MFEIILSSTVGTILGIIISVFSYKLREVSGTIFGITIAIGCALYGALTVNGYTISTMGWGLGWLVIGGLFFIAGVIEASATSKFFTIYLSMTVIAISGLFLTSLVTGPFFWVIIGLFAILVMAAVYLLKVKDFIAEYESIEDSLGLKFEVEPIEPEVSMAEIGGLESVKRMMENIIIGPLKDAELASKYGKSLNGSILLYGPPGCGKTQLAKAVAHLSGTKLFVLRISDILSMWFGKSERNLKLLFKKAKKLAPSIILIDELDALGLQRGFVLDASRKVLSQLLVELDNIAHDSRVFIIGTTNAPWDVDPALIRPGRFDEKIIVPPPDFNARVEIFKIHTSRIAKQNMLDSDVDFNKLAELTKGFSGADIMEITKRATDIPWKEAYSGKAHRKVCLNDFLMVIKGKKTSIEKWFNIAKERAIFKTGDDFSEDMTSLIKDFENHKEEISGYK